MRICYYADARYIHAPHWMRFFVDRGHEMHLISFAEVSTEREQELEQLGIKYHGHTGNFHIKKPWLTLRDLRFVKSVLKNEKIDILHSHFVGPNVWFAQMSGFHPHIITVMGGDVIGKEWKPDKNAQDRWLTPKALKNAEAVTTWSQSLAERIRPFVNVEPQAVHGGVELERFNPNGQSPDLREKLQIPPDGKVVFSSRLIRRLYNTDKFAHAANLICEVSPETYFVMALPETILDKEYVDTVKAIFDGGAARDNIRFVSTIGHSEMPDYYRLADVTVSIPDTDGTPLTVLESMACGTPTVIGNLADYDKEYFEDGKTTVMVDQTDPRSIADGVLRILNDRQLAGELSETARRRVEATGSYAFQMSKMEDIYNSVIAPKREARKQNQDSNNQPRSHF